MTSYFHPDYVPKPTHAPYRRAVMLIEAMRDEKPWYKADIARLLELPVDSTVVASLVHYARDHVQGEMKVAITDGKDENHRHYYVLSTDVKQNQLWQRRHRSRLAGSMEHLGDVDAVLLRATRVDTKLGESVRMMAKLHHQAIDIVQSAEAFFRDAVAVVEAAEQQKQKRQSKKTATLESAA